MIKGEAIEEDDSDGNDDFTPDQFNIIQGWLFNELRGRFRFFSSEKCRSQFFGRLKFQEM